MPRLANIFARVNEHFGVWFMRVTASSILLLLFFVALGGVSQNERWRVGEIKVSGANVVTIDDIILHTREKLLGNYYFAYSRSNSYLFPRSEIEVVLLKTFPRIATVAVSRASDKSINVEVTERKPFGLWCGEAYLEEISELNNCWFIDDTGFVYDRAPIFSKGVYLEMYGGIDNIQNNEVLRSVVAKEQFTVVHAFVNVLKKEVGTTLRIAIKTEGEYGVTIQSSTTYLVLGGVEIQFKDNQDPEILVKNIIAALLIQFSPDVVRKKKLQYIDMRFNNKVVFGFEK